MIDGRYLNDRGAPTTAYLQGVTGVHPETLEWNFATAAFKRMYMPHFIPMGYRTFTDLLHLGFLLELRGSWDSFAPDNIFGLCFECWEDANYISFLIEATAQ